MQEFQKKRKIRKILFSPAVLVAFSVFLVFLSSSTIRVYLRSRAASIKKEEFEQKLVNLEKRKSVLEGEIKRLQSKFGVENELREKFNLRKPGEKTLVIVDKAEKNDKMNSEKKSESFFQKIWQTIKSIF